MQKLILFFGLMFFITQLTAQTDPEVENFNYVLGTQTIGPKYKFTSDDALVETAKEIYNMGSRILKISLNLSSYGLSGNYSDVTSIVRDQPSFKYVVDMPFRDYFFWARSNANWADGYSESERSTDSVQLYNLTKYLLTNYNNTGKTFYLGHWEGDWYLLPNYDRNYVPSDERCRNMANWYRTRQNAVDKAKSDTQFSGVNVFHYAEINQVVDAKDSGKKRVVNCVLPLTNVDYVSYSSYDAQWFDQSRYNSILNYIQANLPPKAGITGKRVFVGEVGNSLEKSGWDIYKHETDNRKFLRTALAWGSPFVLYWEMYNNEFDTANNRHRGFWLINDKNEKQPLYFTFQYFYKAAKEYVANYKILNNRLPDSMEYAAWSASYLNLVPTDNNSIDPEQFAPVVKTVDDRLIIENNSQLVSTVVVYSFDGRQQAVLSLSVGENRDLQLPRGHYLVSFRNQNSIQTQSIIL